MKVYLKENRKGKKSPYKTLLEYEKTDRSLRFNFYAKNSQRYSAFDEDNAPLYEGDVVEVFICVGEKINEYYEIEVAPNGKVFFAKIFNNRARLTSTILQNSLKTEVSLTQSGYDVKLEIPFSSIGVGDCPIRFNAFRIETDGGKEKQNLLALNPTFCHTFHRPKYFIELN